MARDVSKLPPKAQQDYERIKGLLGEVAADSFADEQSRAFGLDKGTAALPPVAAQPLPGLVVEEPELVVPQFPTVTQLQARTGTGEFAPRPTEEDLLGAEAEALRAQTEAFKKQGIPSKEDVQLGIALELRKEGLEPFGASATEYNRRLREETEKVDYAEKQAMKAVAGARRPLTSGFRPQPPIVGESTLAKDPGQVASMGGLEAIGEALRPQVLETPEEAANRKRAQDNLKQLEDSARGLVEDKTVSNIEAGKKQILKGIQNDIFGEVSAEMLGADLDSRKAEARNRYLNLLRSELPDEYVVELQRDEEEAAFGIAGNEITATERAKGMASRGLDKLIGFVASDKYDPEVYKQIKKDLGITPDTEAVVESLPMTIVRDLAGLSRFVFNPLLDAAFYDVNPQTKEKLNPDDMGFAPRERSGPKEERAWGKSYIDQSSDDPVTKALREVAVEIATARSLGDDLAARTVVKPDEEDLIRGLGIVSEIALPLNVLSVPGKLGKIATRGAATGARALKLSDTTVDAFETLASLSTRDIVPNIYNTVVLDKKLLAPLQKAARVEGATLGDELVKSPKLLNALADSNRVSTVAAIQAGDQYAALRYLAQAKPGQLIPTDIANEIRNDAPAIYKALVSEGRTSVNANTIAQRALDRLAKAPQAPIKKAADIANVPVRQETLDQFRMSRQALRTALIEDLSNTQLGQWSFITPNVVASTKVAAPLAREVATRTAKEMKRLTEVNPLTGGFILREKPDIATFLKDSVVIQRPDRTKYYTDLFNNLDAGSELTQTQYRTLNDLVAENAVYNISREASNKGLGAFAPEAAGRALESASEPVAVRSALIQYGKQITDNTRALAQQYKLSRFINPPNLTTSKYIGDVANAQAAFLENYPSLYTAAIKDLRAEGKTAEQVYGNLVARALSSGGISSKTVDPITDAIAKDAYRSVMQIQFGIDYTTQQGKAIKKIIDESPIVSGDGFADSFYQGTKELRAVLVDRFPNLTQNEVVGTGLGSRTFNRDSLPDTILSFTFKKSAETEVRKIINEKAIKFLDQNASVILDDLMNEGFSIQRKLPSDRGVIDEMRRANQATVARATEQTDDIPISFLQFMENAEIEALAEQARIASVATPPAPTVRPRFTSTSGSKKQLMENLNEALAISIIDPNNTTALIAALKKGSKINPDLYDVFVTPKLIEAVNAFKIDALRRTPAWFVQRPDDALQQMNMSIQKLAVDNTEYLVLLPNKTQEAITDLRNSLKLANQNPVLQSTIKSTIAEMDRRAPGLMTNILGDVMQIGSRGYNTLIEGMLGGRALPNLTYLSENIVTAPLIAAVTNPAYIGAVAQSVPSLAVKSAAGLFGGPFGRVGGSMEEVIFNARIRPNEIAIKTIDGIEITNAQLLEKFMAARLGKPLGTLGLGAGPTAQLKQLNEMLTTGTPTLWQRIQKGAERRFIDAVPFAGVNTAVPMTVATQADFAFRGALFKEALRRGLTDVEAATVARETLLDYSKLNRVLPSALQEFKKPFLFLTFSATMSLAMMQAITRGESVNNILRMAQYHKNAAKYAGIYAPGQQELEAVWLEQQREIGDKPVTYTYLRDPIFGQIFWMANIADRLNLFFGGGEFIEGAVEGAQGLGYMPILSFTRDMLEARQGAVPSRHVAFAQAAGFWESMQNAFDIEEAAIGKMRRGEPTFEGKQYRFKTVRGKQAYVAFTMGLSIVGYNRSINDYFNAAVAAGYAPEGAYLARYYPDNTEFEGVQADPSLTGGLKNGLLYMIVRGRAVRPPTQVEAYDKQFQTEMRKLQELQLKEVVED